MILKIVTCQIIKISVKESNIYVTYFFFNSRRSENKGFEPIALWLLDQEHIHTVLISSWVMINFFFLKF